MLGTTGVSTPSEWLFFARKLTEALTDIDITDRTDCIVQILDEDGAESRPIAWHIPATSDIVLNARLIKGMQDVKSLDRSAQETLIRTYFGSSSTLNLGWYGDIGKGRKVQSGYGARTETDRKQVLAMQRIRGVLTHEAAHSKYSHWLLEPWVRTVDRDVMGVMMQLEEVRIESMQIADNDIARRSLRFSAKMIAPSKKELEELKNSDGTISVSKLALNSVLTLGRADRGVLNSFEVSDYFKIVEDIVGQDRLSTMRLIWNDFADIELGLEEEEMPQLAEEWLDLFKDDEDLDLEGLLAMIAEAIAESADAAEGAADTDADITSEPGTPMPARAAAEEVFKRSKKFEADREKADGIEDKGDGSNHGYTRGRGGAYSSRNPKADEMTSAKTLARELEKLSVPNRSVTVTTSVVPPGRLRSRAAVSQAAARSQGRTSTAEPWQRKARKTTRKPKLTVGVMTDVSGSMSWAVNFVASFSWIVSRAINHVNGTVAAVTFGDRAEPILGPGDMPSKVIIHDANGGSEAFNEGCAALDGVLRLTDRGNGVRILFVVSDGVLVAPGEMQTAATWVQNLVKSGAIVVWVHAPGYRGTHAGLPCIPKGAVDVEIDPRDNMLKVVRKLSAEVTKALAGRG